MVLKQHAQSVPVLPRFENDVKMYGTQTNLLLLYHKFLFENDVKMYGTQTSTNAIISPF